MYAGPDFGGAQGALGPRPPQNGGVHIIIFLLRLNLKHIITNIIIFNID